MSDENRPILSGRTDEHESVPFLDLRHFMIIAWPCRVAVANLHK